MTHTTQSHPRTTLLENKSCISLATSQNHLFTVRSSNPQTKFQLTLSQSSAFSLLSLNIHKRRRSLAHVVGSQETQHQNFSGINEKFYCREKKKNRTSEEMFSVIDERISYISSSSSSKSYSEYAICTL